ncbi:precorrin-3B synthase [Salinarimonas sp.]|uniref:precorrin-3B synthase n=1 Tax=Salinarimonas sp. TaxID=2766526 RepID=UPI00391D746A
MSAPVPPSRRGWCPGTRRPMQTGDGLLARVHPFGGILSRDQALALADLAEACGNGLLDVTARGNLQIRGVSEETYPVLLERLSALDLAEPDGPGPHRLTLVSPLAGIDPTEAFDALALARAIEADCVGVTGLPPKAFVAVDGGGRFALPPGADLRIEPAEARARVLLARGEDYVATPARPLAEIPETVAGMLERFAALPSLPAGEGGLSSGARKAGWGPGGELASTLGPHPTPVAPLQGPPSPTGRDRLRDLSDDARAFIAGLPSLPAGEGGLSSGARKAGWGTTREGRSPPGPHPTPVAPLQGPPSPTGRDVALLPLPFGRIAASALRFVASRAPDHLRLSFTRAVLVPHLTTPERERLLRDAPEHGFVVDPADPRLAVEACPGAPACRSGLAAAAADASGIAQAASHLLREGLSLHVSGCAKGCARPRPADLTLVAVDEATYGLVLGGGAGDKPVRIMTRAALERALASTQCRADLAAAIGE